MSVLFGGNAGGTYLQDTWEYTGPRPKITSQPASQTLPAGHPVTLSVAATSNQALTFQWRRNAIPLGDEGSVSGTQTDTLLISSLTAELTGDYACEVTNLCGAVTSASAKLAIDPCAAMDTTGDCNGNGILDSCEISANSALDANSNGVLDACESGAPSSPSCGTCGGGAASMMPIMFAAMVAARYRRRSSQG